MEQILIENQLEIPKDLKKIICQYIIGYYDNWIDEDSSDFIKGFNLILLPRFDYEDKINLFPKYGLYEFWRSPEFIFLYPYDRTNWNLILIKIPEINSIFIIYGIYELDPGYLGDRIAPIRKEDVISVSYNLDYTYFLLKTKNSNRVFKNNGTTKKRKRSICDIFSLR